MNAERVIRSLLQTADVLVDGTRPHDLRVHDPRFYARVLRDESLGLGESYVEGWWDCDAIDELVCRVLAADLPRRIRPSLQFMTAMLKARLFNLQRGEGATRVARLHYNAGNDMYEAMLGPTMNYSCAYWHKADSLDEAQTAKMRLICDKLRLGPQDRVLDIGCGWGGLLRFAASQYGCSGVGITNSTEQHRYAADRIQGLPIEFHCVDYRDPRVAEFGPFTKVSSVGMFEHVGVKNQRTMLSIVERMLPQRGLFLLHTFGRSIDAALDLWVDKYVFPNSYLPTVEDIGRASHRLLIMEDWHNFGADYDTTLMAWHKRFEAWADSNPAQCDREKRRAWRYYLLSFAGAFRARSRIQLWQVVFSKGGVPGGYRAPR